MTNIEYKQCKLFYSQLQCTAKALVNIVSFYLKKIPNREVSNVIFKELCTMNIVLPYKNQVTISN